MKSSTPACQSLARPVHHPKRTHIGLWIALLLALIGATLAQADEAAPPNIVFMFADDLGYGDLASYGHPYARTPALDQLAQEGLRLEQFYVTGVTCSPSRTGLMTGIHPARFEKYAADFGFGDRTTVSELLKHRGYRTGHFGKWHMGPVDDDGTYGLDTVETIGRSRDANLGRDHDLYSAAIDFIRENRDGPFYVNIWGRATHFPVNTADVLVAEFDGVEVERTDFAATMQHKFDEVEQIGGDLDASMRQYLGDVYQIDLNVGRVLSVLDELGLSDNTIVVFSSDHGPAPVLPRGKGARPYSENMVGYAGPYRGGKTEQYEGGTRVPFIIRWPRKIPAGQVDTESVGSFIDWLPTLSALAGVETLPEQLDGEDISDILLGQARDRQQPLFWKTSVPASSPAMRAGDWKLHLNVRDGEKVELYNLATDPSESRNVASDYPQVTQRMTTELVAWVAELPKTYQKTRGNRDED